MRWVDQGKEFPMPAGILSFTSPQMVAFKTFRLLRAEVDFGAGLGEIGLWRDRVLISLPAVIPSEAIFSAGKDVSSDNSAAALDDS